MNHALLLADRVLRESAFGQVLPDAPVLILDEAHDIEEQLTESCSEVWSNRAMTLLFRDLAEEAGKEPEGAALEALLLPWEEAWNALLALVPLESGTFGFEDDRVDLRALADAVGAWVEAGQAAWKETRRLAAGAPTAIPRTWPGGGWRSASAWPSRAWSRSSPSPRAGSPPSAGKGPTPCSSRPTPWTCAPSSTSTCGGASRRVILTSRHPAGRPRLQRPAPAPGPHGSARPQRSEHVESPFDFEAQGLLFVPPDLPERKAGRDGVGEPAWVEASLEAMERLLRASRGRALLLFTSRKMLAAFRPRLEAALPGMTFFVQGEGLTRHVMLERFRTTPSAALLGLASFWQGVDMPGDALSLVIVTALPFAPPDDPVLQARVREADAQPAGPGLHRHPGPPDDPQAQAGHRPPHPHPHRQGRRVHPGPAPDASSRGPAAASATRPRCAPPSRPFPSAGTGRRWRPSWGVSEEFPWNGSCFSPVRARAHRREYP